MAAGEFSPAQTEGITTDETPEYSIVTERAKKGSILIVSLVTFLSPVSGNIYYPAIGDLSRDLHVTQATIYLTISVYMVGMFQ